MKSYETIDHTADIGIRVRGKNLKELFKNSARAMFDQMTTAPQRLPRTGRKTIKVEVFAENINDLLLRWLSELLSLGECKDIVFTDFKIIKLTDRQLKGSAAGFPRKYFKYKTEIKAVTYHELSVNQKKKQCSAQVIFDV